MESLELPVKYFRGIYSNSLIPTEPGYINLKISYSQRDKTNVTHGQIFDKDETLIIEVVKYIFDFFKVESLDLLKHELQRCFNISNEIFEEVILKLL